MSAYDVVRPTLAQLRASLGSLEVEVEALLAEVEACEDPDDLERLEALYDKLIAMGGLVAARARSQKVRLRTYRTLVQVGRKRQEPMSATAFSQRPGPVVKQSERLSAIAELGLTDERHRKSLQELVERASAHLGLPLAAVSIVLDEAQYFVAHRGMPEWIEDADGTPIEWAFCKFAVEDDAELVIEDATADDRTKLNPLVQEGGIRCYLGMPLYSSAGQTLGTLCVIGTAARSFSDEDKVYLRNLAREVVERIERG